MSTALTAALVIIAAVCSACMDTLNFRRSVSVWRNAGAYWTVDKGGFLPLTKYRWNAWHNAKSLQLMCLFSIWPVYHVVLHPVADIAIAGFIYIQVFNLFFDHLFKAHGTA